MEYLIAFLEDPYLFGALLVLVGTGINGRNNYMEGENTADTEDEFDPDKF